MNSSFVQIGQQHPCSGCPAPCCSIHLMGARTPANLMDLDWLTFSLNFPDHEVILDKSNQFTLIRWATCRHFETETHKCKVHNTEAQPRTCVYYNPWKCWYKDNFTTDDPPGLVRMNAARFQVFLSEVVLDENNAIVSHPNMMMAKSLTSHIPLATRSRCTGEARAGEGA